MGRYRGSSARPKTGEANEVRDTIRQKLHRYIEDVWKRNRDDHCGVIVVREDACRSSHIEKYARNKNDMHASCDLPPEPRPLKCVRARGAASGEAEKAAL